MELLILCMSPVMVMLVVASHSWAHPDLRIFSALGVVFMSLMTVVTCGVHIVILTVSLQPEFVALPWMERLLSFQWPSVAYALEALAWDVFFPLSVLSIAFVFGGNARLVFIRRLLLASGVLAFAGLSGVFVNDMRYRSIGIIGYAVVFPVGAFCIARVFGQPAPVSVELVR